MGTVYNIRGTNGSGKSTLARAFIRSFNGDATGGPIDLNSYPAPTKKNPERQLRVEGYGAHWPFGDLAVIGPYRTACGGLDAVSSFAIQQAAIRYVLDGGKMEPVQHVIAEGVLASTVFGSWATFDRDLEEAGHSFAWCYLDTPLEVCFERIAARQVAAGKPDKTINRELVADKHRAIAATRLRARGEGRLVYDLPYQFADEVLKLIMAGQGEGYRVS